MTEFGICTLAVIPVRQEPSEKAEMTTQLLFGDLFEIIDHNKDWIHVISAYDGYAGWVNEKQVRLIDESDFSRLSGMPVFVNRKIMGDFVRTGAVSVHIPSGCSFYREENKMFRAGKNAFYFHGDLYPFEFSDIQEFTRTAMGYLECPYLWGGKTYLGMDCSGFTQMVFKQHGIKLLRDASQQAAQGEDISFISNSRPGDLAFFDHDDGRIIHTGILIDPQHIIHCSGKVRIDRIDHHGIYHAGKKQYTHTLRLIRRLIP
ncbi:MAG: C40 family peptidase [Bacteroidales bacterium]|jgi:gamma-D-glutamyl-L-lysine dipeptidyl-peptidase